MILHEIQTSVWLLGYSEVNNSLASLFLNYITWRFFQSYKLLFSYNLSKSLWIRRELRRSLLGKETILVNEQNKYKLLLLTSGSSPCCGSHRHLVETLDGYIGVSWRNNTNIRVCYHGIYLTLTTSPRFLEDSYLHCFSCSF